MIASAQTDPFAVLGLPREYAIDREALERRFHERSRLLHPDRFARATPAERRLALERTTQLNDAYRILRDPWRRAERLVALVEGSLPPPEADPAFLEELLAIREELAAARSRRDQHGVAAIGRGARDALSALERELRALLATVPPAPTALAAVHRVLARARYHRSVLMQVEAALDLRSAVRPDGSGARSKGESP